MLIVNFEVNDDPEEFWNGVYGMEMIALYLSSIDQHESNAIHRSSFEKVIALIPSSKLSKIVSR